MEFNINKVNLTDDTNEYTESEIENENENININTNINVDNDINPNDDDLNYMKNLDEKLIEIESKIKEH